MPLDGTVNLTDGRERHFGVSISLVRANQPDRRPLMEKGTGGSLLTLLTNKTVDFSSHFSRQVDALLKLKTIDFSNLPYNSNHRHYFAPLRVLSRVLSVLFRFDTFN